MNDRDKLTWHFFTQTAEVNIFATEAVSRIAKTIYRDSVTKHATEELVALTSLRREIDTLDHAIAALKPRMGSNDNLQMMADRDTREVLAAVRKLYSAVHVVTAPDGILPLQRIHNDLTALIREKPEHFDDAMTVRTRKKIAEPDYILPTRAEIRRKGIEEVPFA